MHLRYILANATGPRYVGRERVMKSQILCPAVPWGVMKCPILCRAAYLGPIGAVGTVKKIGLGFGPLSRGKYCHSMVPISVPFWRLVQGGGGGGGGYGISESCVVPCQGGGGGMNLKLGGVPCRPRTHLV